MTVTLAFRKGTNTGWISKLIMFFDKSKYDHVELIIGTAWIGAHIKTGVVVRHLKPLNDKWEYVDVEVDAKYNHKAVEFIDSLHKAKYDFYGAIFGELMGITLINQYDDYFCSELATRILQKFDSEPVMKLHAVNVSPQELYDLYKDK